MSISRLPHIAGMLPTEVAEHLAAQGTPVREEDARRIVAHAISPTAKRARRTRPLPRRIQAAAAMAIDFRPLEILERAASPEDGFVKYLFQLGDGALSEAVLIPLHRREKFTVCLSSQVGCAMGCTFCATGRLGLRRNLEAWEMVAAFVAVRDEAPGRVSGAVFMGQGEPLANYDAVMRAAQILSHPCGGCVGAEAISISTVGLVPQIRRFAREARPYRLIVSLTSAIQQRRASLMPTASRYSLEELTTALEEYAAACKTRVTVAWVLIAGINTGADEVAAIKRRLGHLPLRVNLIDVNDARPCGFHRASDTERGAFIDQLRALEVAVVRRSSGGAAQHAACGMLAARRIHGASSVDDASSNPC